MVKKYIYIQAKYGLLYFCSLQMDTLRSTFYIEDEALAKVCVHTHTDTQAQLTYMNKAMDCVLD